MATGHYMYDVFQTGDPARLGAQVISGIGFLGAGSIITSGQTKVRGLTTAAGLWTAACILISGICIYQLNFRLALKKAVPDTAIRKKLALSLAVFTAPYLFLLPTAWFF